jgi:hypothetical protein
VTKKTPHPYQLKIRPCVAPIGHHRWEILDGDEVVDGSWHTFATEQEAKDNGRQEMQNLVEMWNKK